MSYYRELAEYDARFREVPEPDAKLGDGVYVASLLNFEIVRGKTDPDALYLKCIFGVEVGPEQGQVTSTLQALNPSESKRWIFTKRFLRTLGFESPALSDLEAWLPTAIGRFYEIAVKTKGQYTDVYVNRRLDPAVTGDEGLPEELPW